MTLLEMGADHRWQLGIGDPSVLGWTICVVYFLAAAAAWIASRSPAARYEPRLGKFWRLLAVVLLALGVNKQLDLQTFVLQMGRDVFIAQGWYEDRRRWQVLAAIVGGLLCIAVAVQLWRVVSIHGRRTRLAMLGIVVTLVYVFVRMVSIHSIDRIIGIRIGGVTLNAVLELTGVTLTAVGAWRGRDGHRIENRS